MTPRARLLGALRSWPSPPRGAHESLPLTGDRCSGGAAAKRTGVIGSVELAMAGGRVAVVATPAPEGR
jgi:hypothetical protein